MTGRLYIDEKGTQESFKISKPFNPIDKIAYGTDKIKSYVSCAVYIKESEYDILEKKFLELENTSLQNSQNPNRELKSTGFFKKRFSFGPHSMRDKDVMFYYNLFSLLVERNCSLLTYSISKMSVLVNAKLLEWFYVLDEKRFIDNIYAFKYILTKYLLNGASEEVLEALLDKGVSPKCFLNVLQRDMGIINRDIKLYSKMELQSRAFSEIIDAVKKFKHYADHTSGEAVFDWSQVRGSIDLWQTERRQYLGEGSKEVNLFLDQGIPPEEFEDLKFGRIISGCKSEVTPGIRIADLIVGFYGNLLKQINNSLSQEKVNYEEPHYLNESWFDINETRFNMLTQANTLYFGGGQYTFIFDTFFDQELCAESFIKYFSRFSSFSSYTDLSVEIHKVNFHNFMLSRMDERYQIQIATAVISRGNVRELVESKLLKNP